MGSPSELAKQVESANQVLTTAEMLSVSAKRLVREVAEPIITDFFTKLNVKEFQQERSAEWDHGAYISRTQKITVRGDTYRSTIYIGCWESLFPLLAGLVSGQVTEEDIDEGMGELADPYTSETSSVLNTLLLYQLPEHQNRQFLDWLQDEVILVSKGYSEDPNDWGWVI